MTASVAKSNFDVHIAECDEAIVTYDYLHSNGFHAEFALKVVWISAVSALDHYITELIVEVCSLHYSASAGATGKLLAERFSVSAIMELQVAAPAARLVIFRRELTRIVRFISFQKPNAVADGLAYVSPELHKWQKIGSVLGIPTSDAKTTLDQIVERRNLIAHNADIDDSSGQKLPVSKSDAETVVNFIKSLVLAIDTEFT